MRDFKKGYYEQASCWDKDFFQDAAERERAQEIIRLIPFNVRNILDVGCGNNFFIYLNIYLNHWYL